MLVSMETTRDAVIDFFNRFINLFLVNGASSDVHQWIKLAAMVMLVIFAIVLLQVIVVIITRLLMPAIEGLKATPHYIFVLFMSVIILSYTGDVTFKEITTTLFFVLIIIIVYKYLTRSGKKPAKEPDQQQNITTAAGTTLDGPEPENGKK